MDVTQIRRTARESRPVQRYEAGMSAIAGGTVFEPFTVAEAMQCEENVVWKRAMNSEYESLMQNNTW